MNDWQKLSRTLAFAVALCPLFAQAQSDSLTVEIVVSDSTTSWRDSMEVALLQTTASYAHIERILEAVPPQSQYLNLLPSVLPIDVSLDAFRVTSPFGVRRHPISKQTKLHTGVDVKAGAGMVVKATAPGVVSAVGYDPLLGAFVRLQHAFGFETVYGHLQGYCVRPGQSIDVNQEVGKVGQTGIATGPHLHYTIKKNGSAIDPFQFCFLLRRRLALAKDFNTGRFRDVNVNVSTGTGLRR